jgi:GNAT superfamily N-acetyltransferase
MLNLRPPTSDERRLMASSWFESYRRGGHAPQVRFETYKVGQGRLIDALLSTREMLVAFNPIEPDEVCGWACFDKQCVHYVYVKQAYRRRGIATALLEGHIFKYHTHETRVGRKLAAKLGTQFNPYF